MDYSFGYSDSWPELMVAVANRRGRVKVRVTAEGGLKVERAGKDLQSVLDELRTVLREKGFDLQRSRLCWSKIDSTGATIEG